MLCGQGMAAGPTPTKSATRLRLKKPEHAESPRSIPVSESIGSFLRENVQYAFAINPDLAETRIRHTAGCACEEDRIVLQTLVYPGCSGQEVVLITAKGKA